MLNYGLVSTAVGENPERLLEGVRLLADVAHKHRIPITWAIDTKSVQFIAKSLTTWHTEYGDIPLLILDAKPIWDANWEAEQRANPGNSTEAMASHLVTMREKLPGYIARESERLKRAIPWAEPNVAGAAFKHDVFLDVLEQSGFRGLWGYYWKQEDSDAADTGASKAELDRGGFGCFYPFEASTYIDTIVTRSDTGEDGAEPFKKVVGIPYYTAGHLAEDVHNLRAALLNGTAKQHYDTYVESDAWNRWLGYVEHIDPFTVAQLGQDGLERLDAYFAHVVGNQNTKPLLLSEIADDYITHCKRTEPTTIVEAVPTTQDETAVSKSALKMFYYDAACELTFVEGAMEPVELKNYTGEQVSPSVTQKPTLTGFSPTRHRTKLHIAIIVESTRAMPYGITVWGDHDGLQLTESNADDVRWVGEHLLFIRLTLQPGKNEFNIQLTI
jgi:hypothetical protein